ncbi:cell wall alpha-1,3-glucan synthase mok14 [Schizosaccharomyces japonicus yFS275]|uniref:alpha-1,3-glucan synthase n=1 Tax=Schizosaccharomyces japonicus (strain yFS275 / FY16936) TaxID=402676 RepID=B6K6A8_SCHJY|nr:cell wall alpha-1,3-glucan synthase mok14 [Schizosaccharomyces japonicus yFS275]EEB09062.1 cell wall alpha-1,3-glucan synthase mok14 [Schizosaccharomyces japonicus yFS275]
MVHGMSLRLSTTTLQLLALVLGAHGFRDYNELPVFDIIDGNVGQFFNNTESDYTDIDVLFTNVSYSIESEEGVNYSFIHLDYPYLSLTDNYVIDGPDEYWHQVDLNMPQLTPLPQSLESDIRLLPLTKSYGSSHLYMFTPKELFEDVVWTEEAPEVSHVGWAIVFDNVGRFFLLELRGLREITLAMFLVFSIFPLVTGVASVMIFRRAYYRIEFNKKGRSKNSIRKLKSHYKKRQKLLEQSQESTDIVEGEDPLPVDPQVHRTCILFATLEYNIPDWDIRIKIGGLGVMAELMGQHLPHYDLIWVVPCVGNLEYPSAEEEAPIHLKVVNHIYTVRVYSHYYKNTKYLLLDAPVFRKQTAVEPYPLRMDDFASAIFYSVWNQSIAALIKREPVDLYHINDYHGALAPIYNLPSVIPCAISLHNAEFQGLWPLHTETDVKEVCGLFNLPIETCKKYVQFGNVFNLLHSAISYIRVYQNGFGVVGVSNKYGERSWARYPIFWSLKEVGKLPNPDPTDTVATLEDDSVDGRSLESVLAYRKECKRKAQEWAGLKVDDDADLLVFVGRWSIQKGIDLLADLAPTLLEEYNTQLIVVGPVIDLYGKFAAEKFVYIMQHYPGRVFSMPKFTHLPPFVFGGADFALIPSRDEPFGLVAVEFGRKGALGIGSRVGGLGEMPGWWYTVESSATSHLLERFETACRRALSSPKEQRQKLIMAAVKQRFPVSEWVALYGNLVNKCIRSQKACLNPKKLKKQIKKQAALQEQVADKEPMQLPTIEVLDENNNVISTESFAQTEVSNDAPETSDRMEGSETAGPEITPSDAVEAMEADVMEGGIEEPETEETPVAVEFWGSKMEERFIDANGMAIKEYSDMLSSLTPENSKGSHCIESFLVKVQRRWYEEEHHYYKTRFSKKKYKYLQTPEQNAANNVAEVSTKSEGTADSNALDLPLAQRIMYYKVGSWPVYTMCLSLGQILSVSSFQLTLLSGFNTNNAYSLYVVSIVFVLSSFLWWGIYRKFSSIHSLSLPFVVYALAFTMTGISSLGFPIAICGWLSYVATWIYAVAAASGPLYYSLNFEEEGNSGVGCWVYRACVLQGIQQIWTAVLWLWGTRVSHLADDGTILVEPLNTTYVAAIVWPFALFLIGLTVFLYKGLPVYYRQLPGSVPAFTKSLLHRKVVLWFLFAVVCQNYWMSTLTGRAWRFFWGSSLTKLWKIGFNVCWFLGFCVDIHPDRSWSFLFNAHLGQFPVIGLGFGITKWLHLFWSTSNIGMFLPWAGIAGPYLSRALWLWLAILDAVQNVGIGLILLQTLTRRHVTSTLMLGQLFGATTTILARLTSPTKIGPSTVFPDLTGYTTVDGIEPLLDIPFWVCLLLQIIVCGGYLKYFRRENMSRP